MRRLEDLTLSECKFDDARIRALIPGFRAVASQLWNLSLAGNSEGPRISTGGWGFDAGPGISAEGWGVLATESISQMQCLQDLDLGGCDLDDAKLRALVHGLRAVAP